MDFSLGSLSVLVHWSMYLLLSQSHICRDEVTVEAILTRENKGGNGEGRMRQGKVTENWGVVIQSALYTCMKIVLKRKRK